MSQFHKKTSSNESNLFDIIKFKFLPYWPLLAMFVGFFIAGAMLYIKMAVPKYEASALLLLKDEKKGSDEARLIEDLNIFGSKKIVENELEVIQSRTLMKEVVKNLGLYAPVFMKGNIRVLSAYTTSPVSIQLKDPENVNAVDEVYFTYNNSNKKVTLGDKVIALNEWTETPYGTLKFTENKNLTLATENPLFFSLVPSKNIVKNLLGNLSVSAANKLSTVVNLQFSDEVPERAEDIIDELISVYNLAGINDKNALANNTMIFVEDRLTHVKTDIDSIEKQIQQFRSDKGAINLSEQSSVFLKNVGENDQKASLIDMQLSVLDQVQNFVNSGKSIGSVVPSTLGISDPVLSQLLTKLSTTELEYERLRNTTGANNPVLISLSNELNQLRPNIIESIRIQRINLKASRDQLNETNKKYSATLQTIPEKERNLIEISRQQSIINNVYNFLLQKKEETALSYASTIPDSRILDVAEASLKPTSPKKVIIFPIALLLSFVTTIAIIYLKDFSNSKILFRSDIESLTDHTIIGELSFFKGTSTPFSKNEFLTKQLYQMIAKLGLFNKENNIKKILVTSSIEGEGKSFVSLYLAKELAEAGKRVVLVDFDFIKTTISNTLAVDRSRGVADYLKGSCNASEIICPTEISNLFIVKAGQLRSNYASLFSSDLIHDLFSQLEQSFDFIIIDTALIDPITDDLIAKQFCDYALYLIRHGYTPKALFQFYNTANRTGEFKEVGIIFNGIKSRGFINGFGYGYGYEAPNKNISINKDSIKDI